MMMMIQRYEDGGAKMLHIDKMISLWRLCKIVYGLKQTANIQHGFFGHSLYYWICQNFIFMRLNYRVSLHFIAEIW